MVTDHHLGKRQISAFLRSALPGKNKNVLANGLDYQMTVGGVACFLQPGAGGVTLAGQQQVFDGGQRTKRERREADRAAGLALARLTGIFRRLWHEGWSGFSGLCCTRRRFAGRCLRSCISMRLAHFCKGG